MCKIAFTLMQNKRMLKQVLPCFVCYCSQARVYFPVRMSSARTIDESFVSPEARIPNIASYRKRIFAFEKWVKILPKKFFGNLQRWVLEVPQFIRGDFFLECTDYGR